MRLLPVGLALIAIHGFAPGVVAHEAYPSGERQTLRFTADLSFGGGNAGDYVWGSPMTTISVDDQGHIYLCDPQDGRILRFDETGRHLATLAKKGDGPGEFQQLVAFRVLADGSGLGLDLAGGIHPILKYFDGNMKFVSQEGYRGTAMILQLALLSPLGDRFAAFYVQPNREKKLMAFNYAALDRDFEVVKMIGSGSGPLPDRSRFGQPAFWIERIAANITRFYKGVGVFNFDAEGHLYTALSSRYQVTKWSPDLKTPLLTIEREYKPLASREADLAAVVEGFLEETRADPELSEVITEAVIKSAIERAEIPPAKQPVFGIIPMEDGHVLVVHDVEIATRRNTADIFSREGVFMGEVTMENNALVQFTSNGFLPRMVFKNGFAYSLVTDEVGENQVVRYRYERVKAP